MVYVFILGYVVNALKKIPLEYVFVFLSFTTGISNLLNFALVYANQINFYALFGIMLVQNFFASIGSDLGMIALIGRFSEICPKGLEATGVTFLIALSNVTVMLNGQFSIFLVDYFDIKIGYYERSFGAFAACCLAVSILTVVSPVFSLIKLRTKY